MKSVYVSRPVMAVSGAHDYPLSHSHTGRAQKQSNTTVELNCELSYAVALLLLCRIRLLFTIPITLHSALPSLVSVPGDIVQSAILFTELMFFQAHADGLTFFCAYIHF